MGYDGIAVLPKRRDSQAGQDADASMSRLISLGPSGRRSTVSQNSAAIPARCGPGPPLRSRYCQLLPTLINS